MVLRCSCDKKQKNKQIFNKIANLANEVSFCKRHIFYIAFYKSLHVHSVNQKEMIDA